MKFHSTRVSLTDWEHAPGHAVRCELMPLMEVGAGQVGNLLNICIDDASIFVMEVNALPEKYSPQDCVGGASLLIFRMLADPEVIAAAKQYLHHLATTAATAHAPKEIQ